MSFGKNCGYPTPAPLEPPSESYWPRDAAIRLYRFRIGRQAVMTRGNCTSAASIKASASISAASASVMLTCGFSSFI
jgi:hypothetical protein